MERARRWMCAALAACVMLALLPATVWGADTEESSAAVVTANGAANTYSSLLEAAEAAQEQEGAVVKLLRSVDLGSETLTVTKGRFTLDLNGKSLTAGDKPPASEWEFFSRGGKVLEITGSEEVSLTLVNSDSSNIAVLGLTGTRSGTVIEANNPNAALTIGSTDGTGGQIRLETAGDIGAFGMNLSAGRATCYTGIFPHISLGSGMQLRELLPEGKAFHYCDENGTLMTNEYWIHGIYNGYQGQYLGGSNAYLTIVAHEHTFFDNECACGLVMKEPCPHPEERIDWENAKCCRCQAELQAQLTTAETKVFYPSLADAVAAAQEQAGCTVKILKDVSLGGSTLTVTKGRFTLDLNGKSITADKKKSDSIFDSPLGFGTVLSVTGGAVQLVNSADNIAALALSCSEGSAVDVSGGKLTIGSKDGTGGQIRCKGGTMSYTRGLNWSGGTLKCYSGIFQGFACPRGKQLRDALPAGKLFYYCDENGELQDRDDGDFSIGGPSGPVNDDIILGGRYYITVTADPKYTPVPMGDVNGDGAVDVLDAACLYTYLTTGAAEKYRPEAADVNGDDTVDVYDLQMLYEYIAGLRTALAE